MKKKNNIFKKLIPAAGMLLLSTAMLATSTYAWFSMNKTVTATGMQITAKSDSTYLLINTGDNDSASEIQAAGTITIPLTVSAEDSVVLPSSPALTATEVGYLTTSGKTVDGDTITTAGVLVDNAAKTAAVTNWFTANALAVTAATIDTTTAKQLVDFDGYVIHKTCYITVAAGSNNANNLSVTGTFTQKASGADISACKAVVTTDDGGFAVLTSTNATADISGTNTAITDATVRTVDIYIYYDGDETPVYTNNMANLKGANIEFAFSADPVVAP